MPGHGRAALAVTLSAMAAVLSAMAALAMAGTIAAHLGLLPHGAWQPDEYGAFAHLRDKGVSFLWWRFLSWSPRPLSELAIALYGWAVTGTGQPLIAPVLAVYWIAFLAAAWPALRGATRETLVFRVLGALSVLAFLLLGRRTFSLYYWPFGIVAYLPVVAAGVFVLFALGGGRARGGFSMAAVLTAAAWSSEAGALFATVLIGLLAAHAIVTRDPIPAWRALAVPLLAALPVVWIVLTNNRATHDPPDGVDPALYHHLGASLRAAVPALIQEVLIFDDGPFGWRNAAKGVALKAAFFAGVHALWADTARDGRRFLPVLALAAIATSFAMLAGGFHQFGSLCCDQHAQVRENLEWLAVAALAMGCPPLFFATPRWRGLAGPAVLTAALMFAIAPRAGDLVLHYRHYGEPARYRAMTWASAATPGPDMVLYFPVPDSVFKVYLPPGPVPASGSWWAANILTWFGKERATVRIATRHGEW